MLKNRGKALAGRAHVAFLLCCSFLLPCGSAVAEEITAETKVQRKEVYAGESFVMQVVVSGADEPQKPDVSGMDDFQVKFVNERTNRQTSVTVINGEMTKRVTRDYIFSYRLTPERKGKLTIPGVEIRADGETVKTDPVRVYAREPEERENLKLRLSFSKNACYVGEPIKLTVSWYLRHNVEEVRFSIPLLDREDDFYFADVKPEKKRGRRRLRLKLQDDKVIAEQTREKFQGKDYAVIRFYKILIPKQAGRIQTEQATLSCQARVRRNQRKSGPFADDFFDDAFGSNGRYQKFVVPSNTPELEIKPLPKEGQPKAFAGHVGAYSISCTAEPTDVRVGDPITLKMTVEGPEYLGHVSLPPLRENAKLQKHFKIPADRAEGTVENGQKVFTQTIRPKHSDVSQIPSIRLPYFDPAKGEYGWAESEPIPVEVSGTKVITAADAEGGNEEGATAASEVKSMGRGIRYNYTGSVCLEESYADPLRHCVSGPAIAALSLSPLLYIGVLSALLVGKTKEQRASEIQAKKAYKRARNLLRKWQHGEDPWQGGAEILEELRLYFAAKLGKKPAALTAVDIKTGLVNCNVSQETSQEAERVFEAFEMGRYAGGAVSEDPETLFERTDALLRSVEQEFRNTDKHRHAGASQ